MTVAPAVAQVASRTSEGMAVAALWSHGCGSTPNQPRMVLKTPVGLPSKKNFQSSTATTGGTTTGR